MDHSVENDNLRDDGAQFAMQTNGAQYYGNGVDNAGGGYPETESQTESQTESRRGQTEPRRGQTEPRRGQKGLDNEGDARPEDYYRSQKEVDEAFAKRIAKEREKWETEFGMRQEHGEGDEFGGDGLPDLDDGFLWGILGQEDALREVYPGADISAEIEHNPLFGMMLALDIPLEKAYEFFYPDERERQLRGEIEDSVVERIMARNSVPMGMGGGSTSAVYDVAGISDAQMMDIDKRVKRGERINF